jgi:hypothetical protein
VFGDSVAWTSVRYLPPHPGLDVRDRTALGCGLARGGPYRYFGALHDQNHRCDDGPATWARAVAVDDPDVAVLFVGRWQTMDRLLLCTYPYTRRGERPDGVAAVLDTAAVLNPGGAFRATVCSHTRGQ